MDALQDFFTLLATGFEYFFFAYLAVTFMVYSLQSPYTPNQPTATSTTQSVWERSVHLSTALATG